MRVLTLAMILTLFSLQVFAPPFKFDKSYEKHKLFIETLHENQYKKQELNKFLDNLAYSESAGKYTVWNEYGYIGKYQFGYSARKATGYEHINFYDFIKNPSIWTPEDQDIAMIRLMNKNEDHLKSIISDIETGKLVIMAMGEPVTKSGLLAGAHLSGYGGVFKYVKNGRNPKDAYGTSLESYLHRFSGYNF